MRRFEADAKDFALRIFGKWNRDHEFGEKSRREFEKSQHEARLSETEKLANYFLQKAYNEGMEDAAKIAEEHICHECCIEYGRKDQGKLDCEEVSSAIRKQLGGA